MVVGPSLLKIRNCKNIAEITGCLPEKTMMDVLAENNRAGLLNDETS